MNVVIAIVLLVIMSPTVVFLGVLIYENKKITNKIEKEEEWHQ